MSSFEDKIPAISSLRETISLKWLCLLNDTKVSENVSCFLKLFSNSPSSQSKKIIIILCLLTQINFTFFHDSQK